MKFIPCNENFRIGIHGEIELCTGIKDFYEDLIYEGDWLIPVKGDELELKFRIIYDNSSKMLVGIKTDKSEFKIQEPQIKKLIKDNFYIDNIKNLFFRKV